MGVRIEARQAGLLTYTGTACARCQSTLKYTNGGRCVSCTKASARQWGKDNAEKKRQIGQASHRRTRYGITREKYAEMLSVCLGLCEICLAVCDSGHSLSVDHNHDCCPQQERTCGNCVRGLLCKRCNRLIGDAKEKPELLRAAAAYLKRHGK